MKSKRILIVSLFVLLTFGLDTHAQNAGKATIIDSRHYSSVFGETRNYRIFLPPGYFDNLRKKYPVIYFMHGWSQRYFGSSDPYADFDKGDENKGDNIANFVSTHDVIVVKSDVYTRSPHEK
jgi:poly(3-hydroxybutyrate) depolymerase